MTTPARARRDLWAELFEPQNVIALLIFYCAIHFLVRYLLSPNYTLDESEQVLFGQSLEWGYRFRHPPLITWASWATLTASGNSRAAFFLLKYAIMAAGLAAYFAAARIVIRDTKFAALAVFGLLTTFAIGFLPHVDLMHTVLLATMLAAFLWVIARVLTTGRPSDYLLMALVIGLGILSKYIFVVLPIAALIAIAATPGLRARIQIGPLILSLVLAAALVAPYALWAMQHEYSLFALAETTTKSTGPSFDPLHWFVGAGDLGLALAGFLVPFLVLFPLIYWPACKPLGVAEPHDRDWLRFFEITMLAGVGIMLMAVFFVGTESFKPRWMHQVAMVLPLYLFLRARMAHVSDTRNKIFAGVALVFALGLVGARVFIYETHVKSCKECREYWPMQSYAQAFRRMGFDHGTILAPTYDLAGNLRGVFPDARVVTPGYPVSVFGPPVSGPCLIVWEGDGPLPHAVADYLHTNYDAKVEDAVMRGDTAAPLLTSKGRLDQMNYAFIQSGRCAGP